MPLDDATSAVAKFKNGDLARQIGILQKTLAGVQCLDLEPVLAASAVNADLLRDAIAIKRASAQIDVVIHTVGILLALPSILEPGEDIQSLSLGADNAHSEFDLVTDRRIAEFKFIRWQGGPEALRKKNLFEDFFRLVRAETDKQRYLYLLNTDIPVRFLNGNRDIIKVLDRNRRLADDFIARNGQRYRTVGDYYRQHQHLVQIINLCEAVPRFAIVFRDLPDELIAEAESER